MEEKLIVFEKKFKELERKNATNTTTITTITYTVGLVLDGQFPLIVIMEV